MRIAVLLKQVPDTWGPRRITPEGRLERESSDAVLDDIDERALEVALRVRDEGGTDVVVVTMGPVSATDVLRKGLAMGADSAIHIVDDGFAGADAMRTSAALAAAVGAHRFDLTIAGNESTDGRGGMVPAMIAERLGIGFLGSLDSIRISERRVAGIRVADESSMSAHVDLPAVVTVTERIAEPRFPSFTSVLKAKKKPIQTTSLADIASDLVPSDGWSVVDTVVEAPPRIAGRKILDEGDAGNQIAEYLHSRRLI